MRKLLLFAGFILGNFSILVLALLFLTVYTTRGSQAAPAEELKSGDRTETPVQAFNFTPSITKATASIVPKDVRAEIIDNYFRMYKSPMVGLGKDIVLSADRYQIPYGYLPAIAACEGSLGTAIPYGSYNTWGWGIYGDKITYFPSWQYAIDAVSKGLKEDYFSLGLDTPEKIMPKYTPPSKGSWAVCVSKYLAELM